MLGACASDATRTNLAAIGDVLTKKAGVFVVDVRDFVATERTWLLLEILLKSCGFIATAALAISISFSCHRGAPFLGALPSQEWSALFRGRGLG